MSGFLLDTNIVSDLVRHPSGFVAQASAELLAERICINPIVLGELRFGLLKRPSRTLATRIEAVIQRLEFVELDASVAAAYADIRAHLESAGTPIGANDLWIAAHALSAEMTLVSANTREFERVAGLKLENWLA